jgi:LysM repeat protein
MGAENLSPADPDSHRRKTRWYHALVVLSSLLAITDIVWLISSNHDQNSGSVLSFSSSSNNTIEHRPGSVIYVVKLGDTLSKIADDHGTDIITLRDLNGLADVDLIYAGQELVIPPPLTSSNP